jgi:hypothetical protein
MKKLFRKHMRAFVIVLCATCILAFAMERGAGAGTLTQLWMIYLIWVDQD